MRIRKVDKKAQIERGKRIKSIRENELHMTKTQLARKIDVSSQFLGLVEEGKGNLMYSSIKKLKEVSGHSSDYILYGLDDEILEKTHQILERYNDYEIINAIELLKSIAFFIRKIK